MLNSAPCDELLDQHRRSVLGEQVVDPPLQLFLTGDDAPLIDADAGVLVGRLDDYRPGERAILDWQAIDYEEIGRRQAGPAEQLLRERLVPGEADGLKWAAGKRHAEPFEHSDGKRLGVAPIG